MTALEIIGLAVGGAGLWLCSSILAYRLLRYDMRLICGNWTKGDRIIYLVFAALGGPATVFAALFVAGIGLAVRNNEEPAGW